MLLSLLLAALLELSPADVYRLQQQAIQATEQKRWNEAVALLKKAKESGTDVLEQDLYDPESPFHLLRDRPEYKASGISKEIEQRREAFEQRHRQALTRLGSDPHPPDRYVARNACPFECCTFGKWTADEAVDVYDRPQGTQVIGHLAKGEQVEALTGNVYLKPTPVLALLPKQEAGQFFYLLDYLGENQAHAWRNGKVTDMDLSGIGNYCPMPNDTCSAEYVRPYAMGDWWVQVRTKGGKKGWVSGHKRFKGADACG